jgi:chemotaxis protein methyltransferase CheR
MNEISITDKEFWQIVSLLKDTYGINLSQKKNLIVGRLQNHLHRSNFASFSEFYDYVVNDRSGEAATLLINKLTTNYTFFLREIEHFDFFKGTVLPYIVGAEKSRDMRIWSAGCSSGEEPYSIAMYVADFFGGNKNGWDSKILATDISERVLALAAEGKYMWESLDVLPAAWRSSYFTKIDGENAQIADKLRREVIFRKFNLMERVFPFRKKFHVIWCRNVMIYFDAPTKKALIDKFYDCTEQGGFLFIGHSETIARHETKYKYVMPAIYRKD